ncbi:MAG: hypothetical protein A2126_01905 [Candidatus Woykebacteria bacterium GWB1_45_5]|uniref:Cell division protein FtsL n=2 Tax=Candidatus Woykeibacteriota TaxID=1817899 RepID=A0A1G1W248_9BACT|nr:MAG: hypothetical protein A2113_03835 [Candidatus Woykebacteria bacterium GWA1_44_8]OGY23051.1 MAG: hypothetical protein A2126_01905 [Candidatus Woykebacteria bacterium GWB1_45_5]
MVTRSASKQENRSFYKVAFTVLIVIFLTLSLTRVVLANLLATSGQRLAAANQKIEILEEQNQTLENEASLISSLARIEELAQKSGFEKAENVQVLVPNLPLANR